MDNGKAFNGTDFLRSFFLRDWRPSPGEAFPHILCVSPSVKYLLSRWQYLMHISWVVWQVWKSPTKQKILMTMSTWPQASWSLGRTDNVHPCDTTCCLTISRSESCDLIPRGPPNPTLPLRMLCWDLLGSTRLFRARGPPSPYVALR